MADDDTTPPGPDDAVRAGIEQFQRAALDAVRAARTMLEAAEAVLQEPAAAKAIADTVTAFGRTATEAVAGFAASWPPSGGRGSADDQSGTASRDDTSGSDGPDDGPDGGFERISVD